MLFLVDVNVSGKRVAASLAGRSTTADYMSSPIERSEGEYHRLGAADYAASPAGQYQQVGARTPATEQYSACPAERASTYEARTGAYAAPVPMQK